MTTQTTEPDMADLPTLEIVVRDEHPSPPGSLADEREVAVTVRHPSATVGDLVEALGWNGIGTVLIDGLLVGLAVPLRATAVRRGSVVSADRQHRAAGPVHALGRRADGPSASLRVVSGPDAGRSVSLASGRHVVGRGAGVDVSIDDTRISHRHALLDVDPGGAVTVTDLAPARPSRVDGTVVAGPTALGAGARLVVGTSGVEVVRARGDAGWSASRARRSSDESRAAATAWTEPWRRPPRQVGRPPVPAVTLPEVGTVSYGAAPLGLAAVLATLAATSVVALIMHQPAFLLLGAVGAVGTSATALWQRARDHSTRRSAGRAERHALERFTAALTAHQAAAADGLRAEALELADAVACATGRATPLWERRATDPGAFTAVVGRGDRVVPPVLDGDAARVADDLWATVEAASTLSDVPFPVDLGRGQVVGVVGERATAEALARSLIVQLVAAHGPADLLVAAFGAGDWLRWLPHTIDPASGERLVAGADQVAEVLGRLDHAGPDGAARGGHLLAVVHDPGLLAARNAPLRRLLAGSDRSVAVLVVADDTAALPSVCTTIVSIDADGWAAVRWPNRIELPERVAMAGASAATARSVALSLAGLSDPEQPAAAAELPTEVALTVLLGPEVLDPRRLAARWSSAGDDPQPRTIVAVAADGPVEIDLVRDGPHALVAGTTGSGKSELLRSLVAGLAVSTGPDELSFVLVDYKGGSAFDACARLPHVVGLVTDLDEELAERALRSLDAELHRRERILRDAGAADLAKYRAQPGRPALARLVVVVDEFATLATDLPGFVTSLLGVAQRGRSLGVHLVLATQRPAGAVSDDIRANTNLRLALRVQDGADSSDVIGAPAAATLPRHRPGRALIRFGPGELVPVQIAAVTRPPACDGDPIVTIRLLHEEHHEPPSEVGARTVLDALVDSAAKAAGLIGCAGAHRPWAPPLPDHLPLDHLPDGDAGLLDEPDRQAQRPWRWEPDGGHLLCIGMVGSGVSTALASVVLAAAAARAPTTLHIYLVDGGSALSRLAGLPHVGAVIGPGDDERQARLLRLLTATLHERARTGSLGTRSHPILLVVDQLASWRASVAERLGPELVDALDRLLVDGPAAGIVVAAGLDRPGALPLSLAGAVGERLLFRLADPGDAAALGVRPALVAQSPPGRAVLVGRDVTVQVGWPDDVEAMVARIACRHGQTARAVDEASGPPRPVRALPTLVDPADLPPSSGGGALPWTLTIGLSDATWQPAHLALHPGDHALVAGPARSGKSSALVLIARQVRALGHDVRLVAVTPRRSPLASADVDALVPDGAGLALEVGPADRPVVVLVDDAELVDDADHVLAAAAGGSRVGVHVIASGRVEALRAAYGHWTQVVRRQRRGLLLAPQADTDGDVLSALLPRRSATPAAPGRGYLVADGACELVQLAFAGPLPQRWRD